MTDEPADPTVVAFPQPSTSPPRDAMSERGARPIASPQAEPDPEKIGLFEASMTLRDLLTEVIRGDYTKLDWSVAEALRLIDPGEKSPLLMRYSARIHLRKIAGEIALGREKPTMRSGASYAVVALAPGRADPPPPRPLEIPRRKATVKLDLRKSGVCNLCGRKHGEPGMFVMTWADPVLGAEVTAQFSGQCVAEAIRGEFQRKGQAAAAREEARELGYWKGRMHEWEKAGVDNGWDGGRWALQGFDRPVARKMSGEFISAAISLAGKLRRDWGSGAAWGLPHDTLKALEALLEALGERIDGSRLAR